MKKIRLDLYLTENSYFETREKAKAAIMEGNVFVDNQREDKPGTMINLDSKVEFRGEKLKYVSRGGLKLEKAVTVFKIELDNKVCMDIGASTGGFTDLMIQNGARKVYAIDCGTNQLDYKLRINEKVVTMENTNARYLSKDSIGNDVIDFISVDVSFISLTKIIPVVKIILKDNGTAVMLIKPQFEAGRELVEKNGVVRDKKIHKKVVNYIIDFCINLNFEILGLDFSPIKGPAGNIEYLLYIKNIGNNNSDYNNDCIDDDTINCIIDKSHEILNNEA